MWCHENSIQNFKIAKQCSHMKSCPHCKYLLHTLKWGTAEKPVMPPPGKKWEYGPASMFEFEQEVGICLICGWWRMWRVHKGNHYRGYASIGSLQRLDSLPIDTLEEAHCHLLKNWDNRFSIHPKKVEEAVASIFRNMGYKVAVTSYQKDGGIDVFLYKDGSITGIQVKRKSGKVGGSEIRELVGALVLRNCTEGVFVTTSEFTSVSLSEANVSATMGIPIELYNASRLFDALRISRWKNHQEVDHPDAPWNSLDPHYIWSDMDG